MRCDDRRFSGFFFFVGRGAGTGRKPAFVPVVCLHRHMLFDSARDRLLVLKVVPTPETGRRDLSAVGYAILLISLVGTNCQAPLRAMTVLNWNLTLNSRSSQFRSLRMESFGTAPFGNLKHREIKSRIRATVEEMREEIELEAIIEGQKYREKTVQKCCHSSCHVPGLVKRMIRDDRGTRKFLSRFTTFQIMHLQLA